MASFIAFNEKFQKLNPDYLIKDAVLMTGDKAIDINQSQLYEHSEDRKQLKLQDYSDGDYAKEKQTLNPFLPLGSPDLKYTGSFYDKFYAEVSGTKLTINSTDIKADSLAAHYGEDIYGLNPNNLVLYARNYVKPKILTDISLATGLKIIGSSPISNQPF